MKNKLMQFNNILLSLKKEVLEVNDENVQNYYIQDGIIKGNTYINFDIDKKTNQVKNKTETTEIISTDFTKVSKLRVILEFEKNYKFILKNERGNLLIKDNFELLDVSSRAISKYKIRVKNDKLSDTRECINEILQQWNEGTETYKDNYIIKKRYENIIMTYSIKNKRIINVYVF
ncbi:TPA: hypothetical protein LA460_000081 [Clostridium botulinum]|nr:hypothetical protein [Clostridium botulinum]HBJ1652686.1 hypothetical protein [Clostridium botulinum]